MVKEGYTLLARYPLIDYVLIDRHTEYSPYVACWAYCDEDGTWGQGHYFETEDEAREYILKKYEEETPHTLARRTMELDER